MMRVVGNISRSEREAIAAKGWARTKRLARRACPRPPVLSRVTFMRDARALAAGHSSHFNPQHWLLFHMGLY